MDSATAGLLVHFHILFNSPKNLLRLKSFWVRLAWSWLHLHCCIKVQKCALSLKRALRMKPKYFISLSGFYTSTRPIRAGKTEISIYFQIFRQFWSIFGFCFRPRSFFLFKYKMYFSCSTAAESVSLRVQLNMFLPAQIFSHSFVYSFLMRIN